MLPKMQAVAQIPGIVDFARSVGGENDPTYDPVEEFNSWRNAMVAIRDHIIATFPQDGQGFLLQTKFSSDGSTFTRTFPNTAPDMVTLVTLLDAAIATIG
jgi:hypothetical protein